MQFGLGVSLPYPEAGIRLIRQEQVEPFDNQMSWFQEELADAVDALDERYHELQTTARQRLGSLYDPADYPESLRGLFLMDWEFPAVEPPDYLMQLNPELYEQECQRVAARFDDAVELAEQAFVDELSKLVSHLTERLTGQADGKPKVFRDSAIENLTGTATADTFTLTSGSIVNLAGLGADDLFNIIAATFTSIDGGAGTGDTIAGAQHDVVHAAQRARWR